MSTTTIIIIVAIVIFVVFLSAALSIASFSYERFMQEYNKLVEIKISQDITIIDFVHTLNYNVFGGKITLKSVQKDVNNYYMPKAKMIALSERTLTSNSLASFSIVAHEMGHALQDKEGNKLKILNALRRIGWFIGFLFLPLILTGIILLFFGEDLRLISYILLGSAVLILLLAIIIKARTIIIEKDASDKGVEFLKQIMTEEELAKCKKLLVAARLTYWGDLFRLLLSWTMLTKKTNMFR